LPGVTGAGNPLPLSSGTPARARRKPFPGPSLDAAPKAPVAVHRTPVESIEAAAVEARARGHTLAGFVRRCGTTGCSFVARCRTCHLEVAVQKSASAWSHRTHLPPCSEHGLSTEDGT
jgi:hypothetical protein